MYNMALFALEKLGEIKRYKYNHNPRYIFQTPAKRQLRMTIILRLGSLITISHKTEHGSLEQWLILI